MSWIPLTLQLLPLIPGLIDSGIKIADAVMQDPATTDDDKKVLEAQLDELSKRLELVVARVRASRFPDFSKPL